eukprot:1406670-Prymnesium_polylepis.1
MKFVNPHTGADVADHEVGTHLYKRVRFDDNMLRDMCFAAQPGADWLLCSHGQRVSSHAFML